MHSSTKNEGANFSDKVQDRMNLSPVAMPHDMFVCECENFWNELDDGGGGSAMRI